MKRARPWLVATLTALGCGPSSRTEPPPGEILLYIDTDAPVPAPAGGVLPKDAPPPLFDSVRIDVLAPGETDPCATCTNTFDVDVDLLRSKKASIGIAPPPGVSGYRARVRLFSAANMSSDGEPAPAGAIDVTVALPRVGDHDRIEVTVPLMVDDVGVPVGSLDAPVDPTPGPPSASVVGTWPGAQRVPCASAPPEGEVCVPGGAFWLGTADTLLWSAPPRDSLLPRLTIVSPFFMSATEVTVGQFRSVLPKAQVFAWSGSTTGNSPADFCTYTQAPANNEDLPVNCVPWVSAEDYCRAIGAKLPTEAQFEYVAGALAGYTFVWGDDAPECSDAVFGRAGYGVFLEPSPCRSGDALGGVLPPGSGARDRLQLPTGTIVDLIGNVAEFALDDWNRHDERCWSAPGVYRDPVCHGKSADGNEQVIRGGDWQFSAGTLVRAERIGTQYNGFSPEAGFRCARSAKAP